MKTTNNLKFAGWYHDDIAYNPETDCMDLRKVKIRCPECDREFAALLSKHTAPIRHFTIDMDGELHAVEMKTYCMKCKTDFAFNLDCG
jgi:hypothetical protein